MDGGKLHGSIKTGSGDVSTEGGATISGSVATGSGNIKISANSSVSAASQMTSVLQTVSGNIQATDSIVQGQIKTGSGCITLRNATVDGDVTSSSNNFSIDQSSVAGTLTAVGDSLRIGDHSSIDKIVLKVSQTGTDGGNRTTVIIGGDGFFSSAGTNIVNGGSGIFFSSSGMSIVNSGGGSFFSSSGTTIVNGQVIERHNLSGNSNGRSASRVNNQTIHLGAGTKVRNIEFAATNCKVVLGPGAEYSGPRPEGMTIEQQETRAPRSTAQALNARSPTPLSNFSAAAPMRAPRSTAQALNAGFTMPSSNFSAAAPMRAPAQASTYSSVGGISLPEQGEFSTRAEATRIRAIDAVFDAEIRNEDDISSRRALMGQIGDQYIEGLQSPKANNVNFLISQMMTDEDKAKILTSICYSTLINADLEREDPACDKLKTLCEGATDIADAIKSHIEKVDGTGIRGGLLEPVTGAFRMLNQPDGRLPYATQMMLDNLGIRR